MEADPIKAPQGGDVVLIHLGVKIVVRAGGVQIPECRLMKAFPPGGRGAEDVMDIGLIDGKLPCHALPVQNGAAALEAAAENASAIQIAE